MFIQIVLVLLVIWTSVFLSSVESKVFVNDNSLAKRFGINEILLNDDNHRIEKRFASVIFRGNPKSKIDILARNFKINSFRDDQSDSLIKLLHKISVEYLNKCPPYIYYDKFAEKSENFDLKRLFESFPLSFYHARIDHATSKPIKFNSQNAADENCKSYILFLSDPSMTRKIIGPQTEDKVVIVARSSQWKLRDFLSSSESSDIVNLLVIGESLTSDPRRERPYVLYTHHLYADGLGSNTPVVLTSWIKGVLSRPHVNLFPPKFISGFSGHRFLVAAMNQPPFIFKSNTLDSSGTSVTIWEGIEYRLMNLISQRLNFSCDISESSFYHLGSGEAIRKEILLGQADIGMGGVYVTESRLKDIEMSFGHSKDCAAFITLASKALPKYRAIMGPFQWPVWVALTTVYLGGIFPLAFTDRLSLRHLIGNWSEIENMFWYVFGTFTNSLTFSGKYSWSNSQKMSTRLLVGFYWLFTIIITACYTGSIIAFVTLPAFPDTVDSVNDLLGLFFRVATLDRGGWDQWFQNSTHESTAKLYKKMEFVSSVQEGISNVTKSFFWNYAFLGSRAELEYLVQANFTEDKSISKRSALHLSEECFAPFEVGYSFPKNSVYAKKINEIIIVAMQSGIITKITNDVSWAMQRSSSGKLLQASSGSALREIIQEERQLTTADTEGMFLLMGFGYLVAALVLISEVIGGFTNKCRQIIQRSRKSISTISSKRNSQDISDSEGLRRHFERKAERESHLGNEPTGKRFFGLNELNLTKATLMELYGGNNKREPTLIVQNGCLMLDSDAKSSESESLNISDTGGYENDQAKREELIETDAIAHFDSILQEYTDEETGLDRIDENSETEAQTEYLNDGADNLGSPVKHSEDISKYEGLYPYRNDEDL